MVDQHRKLVEVNVGTFFDDCFYRSQLRAYDFGRNAPGGLGGKALCHLTGGDPHSRGAPSPARQEIGDHRKATFFTLSGNGFLKE
jgi:hypothetical protein